jgi:hypothetical protein
MDHAMLNAMSTTPAMPRRHRTLAAVLSVALTGAIFQGVALLGHPGEGQADGVAAAASQPSRG